MRALVIVVRGLHLGYLGCYGNDWIDTPTFDRLAAEGIIFDQHYADHPSAAGAVHAWRTGCYDLAGPGSEAAPLPPSRADLVALLTGAGVQMKLILDANQPEPPGLAQGWGDVQRIRSSPKTASALEKILAAVGTTVERLTHSENWLLWVDLPTLLPPWELPEEYRELYFEDSAEEEGELLTPLPDPPDVVEPGDDRTFLRLQRTYAGAVSYLDTGLEQLFDTLREQNRLDEVMLLLTSDHGFPLGEHGTVGEHRPWLYDERIHLPLLVRLPGGSEAGRHVAALTQAVDLFPTLAAAFGLPVPDCHGHDLLPLLHGRHEPVRPYAGAGLRCGEAVEWALRTPEWSFLLPVQVPAEEPPRRPQLYVKPDDRWEVNNVVQHHLELAEQLEKTLRAFEAATRQPGPLHVPRLPAASEEPAENDKGATP